VQADSGLLSVKDPPALLVGRRGRPYHSRGRSPSLPSRTRVTLDGDREAFRYRLAGMLPGETH